MLVTATCMTECVFVDPFELQCFSPPPPRWGTVDAEIKVTSAENPKLSKVLSAESGVQFCSLADLVVGGT